MSMERKNEVSHIFHMLKSKLEDGSVFEDRDAILEIRNGKVVIPDYNHAVYRHKEFYSVDGIFWGFDDDEFIVESDPKREFRIKYCERKSKNPETGELERTRAMTRIRKSSGKIVIPEND